MKVTVKSKQVVSVKIPFDEIPSGSVYELDNGIVLLKVGFNNAVILKEHSGCDYFGMSYGYKCMPAIKILGKLTEVIVEEV